MAMAQAEAPPRGQLLRILGVGFGVAVGLGSMIGSGVLRSPSAVAASLGDARLILALWVVGALHSALSANVMVELGAALPREGGPYVYARRALGDAGGLVVGWSVWSAMVAAVAAASVSFANFLAILAPALAPHAPGVAVALQVLLYGANILGLREGRALQEATSLAKALLLLTFAIAAAFAVPAKAASAVAAPASALSWIGIMGAYKLIRGAYAGWDSPMIFAEENADPARSLPRAVFYGLAATSALYVAVNAGLLQALGVRQIAASALPFMTVLAGVAGPAAAALFAVGAMVTVLSCANANIMMGPRVIFALARDRLLPHGLAAVNRGGSPYRAFALSAAASLALAATGRFALVFGLIGVLNTLSGVIVTIAFFVLRRREPALPRPFRALGHPVLPALLLALDASLLVLFNLADVRGFIAAAALVAICAPLAWIARRAPPPRG